MSETKEWIFFIDCDAFFTDFETSIGRLLATYSDDHADRAAAAAVQFLVAEDPGGINTGVFLIRNSPWSVSFLERVASSNFMDEDFTYPKEVRLVHQAHFNAFVPPASVDWMAYEWRPGDFSWSLPFLQEQPCLKMMLETAQMAPLRAQEQVWVDQRSEWMGSCQLASINLLAYGYASKACTLSKEAAPENSFSVHTTRSTFNFVFAGDAECGPRILATEVLLLVASPLAPLCACSGLAGGWLRVFPLRPQRG
eukprot:g2153.t1